LVGSSPLVHGRCKVVLGDSCIGRIDGSDGPIYGWATTPGQIGVRRLPRETPVAGLFLAGHWTQPAHGLVPVMMSGIRVARIVLGASTSAPAVPLQL
jgi:hypothetical protein